MICDSDPSVLGQGNVNNSRFRSEVCSLLHILVVKNSVLAAQIAFCMPNPLDFITDSGLRQQRCTTFSIVGKFPSISPVLGEICAL